MPTSKLLIRAIRTGICFAALGGWALAQQPTPTAPSSSHSPINRRVRSPGNAVWAASVTEARKIAKADHKLVYYEFVSKDCGDCRRMQGLLDPAFEFEALLIGMVPVQVALSSSDGTALAEIYKISEEPSVLITNPDGRLVFLMQGFKDAGDFYAHVHKDLDEYRQFAKTVDHQDLTKLTAAEAYATGKALYKRYDFAGAAARLDRAANAPDTQPEIRESALMGFATAEVQLGNFGSARSAAQKVIDTTKSSDQKERAELLVAEIALSENKPGEALEDYKRFQKEHPKSPYLAKVRDFIGRLESAKPKS